MTTKETMPAAFIRALPAWIAHPWLAIDLDGEICLDWMHETSSAFLSVSVSLMGSIAYGWRLGDETGHGHFSFTDHGIPKELDDVFYRMRELIGVRPECANVRP